MRLFRAEAKQVAFRDIIFSSGDDYQLDFSFEDISEFFAFVLKSAAGATAWHNVVKITFQQMGARIMSERFELIAVPVGLELDTPRRLHHDLVGIGLLSKKFAHCQASHTLLDLIAYVPD